MIGRKKTELVDLTRDDNHMVAPESPRDPSDHNNSPPDVIVLDDSIQPDVIDVSDSDSESTLNQTIRDRTPQPYRRVPSTRRTPPPPPPPPPPASPDNSLKCPICIESYKNVKKRGVKIVVTRCGHLFCDFCLKKAIGENGRSCPKCRRNIPKGPTAIIEVYDKSLLIDSFTKSKNPIQMGVRGLKSFVEKNEDLLDKNHRLHHTHIVIDACNLISALFKQSQKHERRDLFGGDMVQFGKFVIKFFEILEHCKIRPILVFDGAQTYDQNKSKTAEKHRRALDRFLTVMSINKSGFGDFILPATATNVFRSIASDKNLKLIQCMFEADLEVARIAQELKCPVISNDSDFILMDLPYGLIPIDLLNYERVQRCHSSDNKNQVGPYFYLESSIYYRDNFTRYLPNLDVNILPLLGVLAGNDFISGNIFEKICSRLPNQRISLRGDGRQFKKPIGKSHEKIARILYFLCGKTQSECINQLCLQVVKDKRRDLKKLIKSNIDVYNLPIEDTFKSELARIYWTGFQASNRRKIECDATLKLIFDENLSLLVKWFKRAMEHSVLSYRCLELANRNIIFIIGHMDDPQLPSAHLCQIRPMRVMLALLRSFPNDFSPCVVYDRVGHSYCKQLIRPIRGLKEFGKLDYTIFDLISMAPERRCAILLATFHCNYEYFEENIVHCYDWFDVQHAEEFLIVKLLMDFADYECKPVKFWKHFRQATLMCMIYHFFKDSDQTLSSKFDEVGQMDFLENLTSVIKIRHFSRMPTLNKKRRYNCRIMHQITQLQSSIISFNNLNAFLGDIMIRVRPESWLNSCIVYNLAEGLHDKSLKLPETPIIIHNIPRIDKMKSNANYN